MSFAQPEGARGVGAGILAAALALLAAGCAGAPSVPAERTDRVHEVTAQYSYDVPLDEVWPQVRPLLEADGYDVRTTDAAYTVVTEWQEHLSGPRAVYTRYLVQGFRLVNGGCQIRAWRQLDTTGDPGPARGDKDKAIHPSGMSPRLVPTQIARWADTRNLVRDLDFEWQLLRRTEPDMAQRIEAMAAYEHP